MTATVAEEEPIRLSDEQKKVLRIVRSGKNVFFTGPAGMLALFKSSAVYS